MSKKQNDEEDDPLPKSGGERSVRDFLRTVADQVERGNELIVLFRLAQEMANVVKDEVVCPACRADAGTTCQAAGKPFTPQHKARWLAAIHRGNGGRAKPQIGPGR